MIKTTGLSWRIGMPFLLLMLAATVTVVVYMRWRIGEQRLERLQELAAANAAFIDQASLPPTDRLAADLRRVTGLDVYFRRNRKVSPAAASDAAAPDELGDVPADGLPHALGAHRAVGVALSGGDELLFVQRDDTTWLDPRIVQVVVPFWALALLLAVLVARGLVRPLRNLTAELPRIEAADDLVVPEVDRRDEIGDVARALVATHHKVHEERERRLRAEKLAVLGRMTASLAHEIQNPAAAIKMHAQLWLDREADGPARVIVGEVERIEALVNQWMFLTRPEPPAFGRADLVALLRELGERFALRLEHAGARLQLELPDELTIDCDAARLTHVFSNLLSNAIQAMPEGGVVTISAQLDGPDVVVLVADEGKGFSAAALRHFPQFFFSEKEGGMGIGLAVASQIVAAHGGSLRAENRGDGGGALLRVVLPRHHDRSLGRRSITTEELFEDESCRPS